LPQVTQKALKRQKGAVQENTEEEAQLQLEVTNAAIARRDAEIAARAAEIEELRAALQEFKTANTPASLAIQAEKKYGLRERKAQAESQDGAFGQLPTSFAHCEILAFAVLIAQKNVTFACNRFVHAFRCMRAV
jgi:hypothetical protein